ncbi:MAG TPA: hypothetical protein DEQ02_04895 [Ruminococcaceae bacterium]|nr:hypothetical protein [Oscillospiraceae bacterium]
MRTSWVPRGEMEHILAALTAPNRLACEISLATGLRIGDVLSLKADQIRARFVIYEQKTGKRRAVYMPSALLDRARRMAGHIYVFPHRYTGKQHRTRQAVFRDLKRAAKLFRISGNVAPHSLRKVYAVELFNRTKSVERIKKLLNHSDEAVTMLYAMADRVEQRVLDTKNYIS